MVGASGGGSVAWFEKHKKHCFHEALKGVAIVDMKQPDGMLFLGGVNSIDQINIINGSIFSIFLD